MSTISLACCAASTRAKESFLTCARESSLAFDRDSVAPSLLSVLAYSASVVYSVGVASSNMPLILSQLVKDVMLIARNATGIIFFVYFFLANYCVEVGFI